MVVFTLQLSGTVVLVTWFNLNRDQITEWFCENKSKPDLDCKGKCYLMKQVKAEEKQQQRRQQMGREQTEVFYLATESFASNKTKATVIIYKAAETCSSIQYGFPNGVFQPPCC